MITLKGMRGRNLLVLGLILLVLLGTGVWVWLGLGGHAQDVAARVAGNPISYSELERWTTILELEEHPHVAAPLGCPRCVQWRATARPRALEQLINQRWILGEATRHHLRLPDAEVQAALKREKRSRGMTSADLLTLARVEVANDALDKVFAPPRVKPMSAQALAQEYARERVQFEHPATVDLQYLWVTGTRKRERVRRALARKMPFGLAARRFSEERSSAVRGGISRGATAHDMPPVLARLAFSARLGRIYGPVRIDGVWTWYRVSARKPALHVPRSQAYRQLQRSYQMNAAYQAQMKRLSDYQAYWRARTECAKEFARLPECRRQG